MKIYKCKAPGRVEFIPMTDGFVMFRIALAIDKSWVAVGCANDRLQTKDWTHVQLSNFLELLVQTGWTKERMAKAMKFYGNENI